MALIKVASTTLSTAAANIVFDNVFTDDSVYSVQITRLGTSAENTDIIWRFRSGGSNSTSTYSSWNFLMYSDRSYVSNTLNQTAGYLQRSASGSGTNETASGFMQFEGLQTSTFNKAYVYQISYFNSAAIYINDITAGLHLSNSVKDGIWFSPTGGHNFKAGGSITIYRHQ